MDAPVLCEHMGKKIVEFDFSGVTDIAILNERIAAYQLFIASHPKRSLRILSNLTGCSVNRQTIELFKEFTTHNKPYIIASAVYGLTGFPRIFVNAVNQFSKRDINLFDDPSKARNWLVTRS
jgi:hypothetical protein